ncbi:hypothetical protein PoB_006943700 [Plakobranchus ocellatus]|uniref:Uncharacterized protein n=1 Tax=Plakobranchus ocellatus TaxID=259542 RepID=A0AAV4DFB5_9GAST|nr:hypothetical protein PoB_006943700 [Plakobranchus ocellatus]
MHLILKLTVCACSELGAQDSGYGARGSGIEARGSGLRARSHYMLSSIHISGHFDYRRQVEREIIGSSLHSRVCVNNRYIGTFQLPLESCMGIFTCTCDILGLS